MTARSKSFDVAIVGAGPAGASLAIRLAVAGLTVLLVEQKKFPREKLCGEFISPECIEHFAELGALPDLRHSNGTELTETIFFTRKGRGVSVKSEWFGRGGSYALGLSRAEMDRKLMERAANVGVTVMEETSAGFLNDNIPVAGLRLRTASGESIEVAAKLTVDATGRTRSLARRFADPAIVKKPAKFVAFKTHLKDAKLPPGVCEIYAYSGGYGGCNRVEDDLYNLCFITSATDAIRLGSDADRVMREVVLSNRRAYNAMKDATVVKPWLAVPIERFGRGQLVPARGLITVGDAAAFIDPFTGSGILLSLESSCIAASAIELYFREQRDFDWLAGEYGRGYAAAFDRRLRICAKLRFAAFVPFLAEATIIALGVSTSFRKRIARSTRFSEASGV